MQQLMPRAVSRLSPGKRLYNAATYAKNGLSRLSPGKRLYSLANRAKDGLARLSPGKRLYNHANASSSNAFNASGNSSNRGKQFVNRNRSIIYPSLPGDKPVEIENQMENPSSWRIGTNVHPNSE